jgi:hypothetical protein
MEQLDSFSILYGGNPCQFDYQPTKSAPLTVKIAWQSTKSYAKKRPKGMVHNALAGQDEIEEVARNITPQQAATKEAQPIDLRGVLNTKLNISSH